MPFNINTFTTTAQTVANGEIGFLGTAGGISTETQAAVTLSGSSVLTVMGVVSASGADAVVTGASTGIRMIVGASGSVVSAFEDAVSLVSSGTVSINTAGTILGQGRGLSVADQGASINFNLVNSGDIASSTGAAVAATISTGSARIVNSGTMTTASDFQALSLSGSGTSIMRLSNSGTISNSGAGLVVTMNGAAELRNTGTIIGDVSLSGASIKTLVNRGLIEGDIFLGSGDDTVDLLGGTVTGTVDGGGGNDTYWIDDPTVLIEDASGGFDRVISWVSYTAGSGIEQLRLQGDADLRGTLTQAGSLLGNGGDNVLIGSGESDIISSGLGRDRMIGRSGDDIYAGNALSVIVEVAGGGTDTFNLEIQDGPDELYVLAAHVENLNVLDSFARIVGNAGNNRVDAEAVSTAITLDGGGGFDILIGGDGNTTFVTNGGDTLSDTGGVDTVRSSVSFTLATGFENLVLTGPAGINGTGNAGANTIIGNAGANVIDGGGGTDTMRGGGGNDTYVTDGGDTIVEAAGQGIDTVRSLVSATLGANLENLFLEGGATLATGNLLANVILGTSGGNVLNGRQGSDTLTGGSGLDTFVFDTGLSPDNIDRITDFIAAEDTIRLDRDIFSVLPAGSLAPAAFASNTTGLAGDSSDRIIYETDTGRLFYDRDGNGAVPGIHFATLNAGLVLTSADFVGA